MEGEENLKESSRPFLLVWSEERGGTMVQELYIWEFSTSQG